MRRSLGFALLFALGACGKHDGPSPKTEAPRTESPAKPDAPAPGTDAPPAVPHVDQGLLGELTRQAAARPHGKPTVEEVLAAFADAHLEMARTQQVLATPIGARYCLAAVTKVGLNMSICEFETLALAKAGRERSLKLFKAIQRRTLLLNGQTLLTLIVAQEAPPVLAERDEAEKRFRALSATLK